MTTGKETHDEPIIHTARQTTLDDRTGRFKIQIPPHALSHLDQLNADLNLSQDRVIMSLLSGIEILTVLVVVGVLFLLSVRLRTPRSNVVLCLVVGLLLVGLISVSKLAMALFGGIVFLAALLALLVIFSFRHS